MWSLYQSKRKKSVYLCFSTSKHLGLFIFVQSLVWKPCVVVFEVIKKISTEWPQIFYVNNLGDTVLRDHRGLLLLLLMLVNGKLKHYRHSEKAWSTLHQIHCSAIMHCVLHTVVADLFHLGRETFLNSFYQYQSFTCI